MIPSTSHIVATRDESRTVRTFTLDCSVEAEPGQFLMVWLPGVGERPLSLMSPDPLSLTVARVGPFTIAMHRRSIGDPVSWRGPFGKPFRLQGQRILLVAGGYGAAPLYFLARRARERGIEVCTAIGARTGEELILVEDFRALGCSIVAATDRGDVGFQGHITEAIAPQLQHFDAVYACGPELMLYSLAQMCWEADVPGQVSLERYMKCGFGLCGQCAMDDKLVCRDGPVFDIDDLRNSQDFGHFTRTATGRRVPL